MRLASLLIHYSHIIQFCRMIRLCQFMSKSFPYKLTGQTKANPTPSFELLNANTDKNGMECDAAPLDESEYMYATTPECTWDKHAPLPNTASANTSQSNSEPRTKVGKSLQHKHTDSTKDEGSGDAATGTVPC